MHEPSQFRELANFTENKYKHYLIESEKTREIGVWECQNRLDTLRQSREIFLLFLSPSFPIIHCSIFPFFPTDIVVSFNSEILPIYSIVLEEDPDLVGQNQR